MRWLATLARPARCALLGAVVGMLAVGAVGCATQGASAGTDTTIPEEETNSVSHSKTITVTSEGKTTVKPDTANVNMGVRVSGPSAQDVLAEANEKAAALIAALKALGVADDDIVTAGLSIYPQYDSNGRNVTGFEASNSVNVTIRDIDRAGEIIDGGAAFAGDAITIGGIFFSVADPEAVMADARVAAIENAKKRAGEYAEAAGVEVGEVLMISEIGATPPMPLYREYAAADEAGSLAIQTGTTDLSATVTVVFALG
jgi:uncharacterized protein YggE